MLLNCIHYSFKFYYLHIFNRLFIDHVSCDCGTNNNISLAIYIHIYTCLVMGAPVHVKPNNLFLKMFFEI